MGDKLMLDGREVKVGDRLYCLAFGPQVVTRLLTCNPRSPLCLIDVFGEERDYSTDGKLARGCNRTLYWDEPTITPKPIRRKVTKWRWVVTGVRGGLFVSDDFYSTAKDVEKAIPASAIQKIDSTAKEFDEEDA